jgi:hypothetical protein
MPVRLREPRRIHAGTDGCEAVPHSNPPDVDGTQRMRHFEPERLRTLPLPDQKGVTVQLSSVAAPSAPGCDQERSGKGSDAGHAPILRVRALRPAIARAGRSTTSDEG